MVKSFKLILVFVIGLLLGLIIHGFVEILAIWILTNWLSDFFFGISWSSWLQIHLVFSIIVEILGVALAFWIYKKYEK